MENQKRYQRVILNGREFEGPFDCKVSDDTIELTKYEKEVPFQNFFKMGTTQKTIVENWLFGETATNEAEKALIGYALMGLQLVKEDYCIATLEPAIEHKHIIYEAGIYPTVGISKSQWIRLAESFDTVHGSRLATYLELILWYCYRAAIMGLHINVLLKNYSIEMELEKVGAKNVLGFTDGLTNTAKVVTWQCKPVLVGKPYNGEGTIVDLDKVGELKFSTGAVVLTSFA